MPVIKNHYVHVTDIMRFKQCRQLWSYSSPLRANLTPVKPYRAFIIGKAIHYCLEQYYKFGISPIDALITFKELQLLDSEEVTLITAMLKHYGIWQGADRSNTADKVYEFLALEHNFKTLIWRNSRNRLYLSGKFDGIVYNRLDSKYYLWELKTAKYLDNRLAMLTLDAQATAYMLGAATLIKELGIEISGIVYTIMRKAAPKTPEALQNGLLSKRKDADTTAEWYLHCAKQYHSSDYTGNELKEFIRVNYLDQLNNLAAQPNKFFRRIVIERSLDECLVFRKDLINVAQEMISPKTAIYPNEGYNCPRCSFYTPCVEKHKNAVLVEQSLLANHYTLNTEYATEDPED